MRPLDIEELKKLPTHDVIGLKCINLSHVDPAWEEGLSDCLMRIAGFSVFLSALAFQCTYKWSLSVPTAAAAIYGDKFYIIINPYFFYNFLEKGSYRAFVVVHETWHIFYEHSHLYKEGGYNREVLNQALDYFLHCGIHRMIKANQKNPDLVQMTPKEVFPLCFDMAYDGWTEDEIYADLIKNEPPQEEPEEGSGGSTGEGDGDGSVGSPTNGRGQKSLDGEMIIGEDPSSTEGATKQAISRAVSAAYNQAIRSNSIGDAESDMMRSFIAANESKVDWKTEVEEFLTKAPEERLSYKVFNARSSETIVLPSKDGERVRLFVGIDTSGSMAADLEQAVSEIHGIASQIDSWSMDVWSCDVKAFPIVELSSQNLDDVNTAEICMRGGGGTDMAPLIEAAQENNDDDDPYGAIVIITDGYIPEWESSYEGEIPLLFVITPSGAMVESDHAKCIRMNQ